MENVSLFETRCPRPLVVLHCVPAFWVPTPALAWPPSHISPFSHSGWLTHYPKVNHMHVLTERKGRKMSIFAHGMPTSFYFPCSSKLLPFGALLTPQGSLQKLYASEA